MTNFLLLLDSADMKLQFYECSHNIEKKKKITKTINVAH